MQEFFTAMLRVDKQSCKIVNLDNVKQLGQEQQSCVSRMWRTTLTPSEP